jgi:Ca2+-binding EF-hand superfamily protein
MAETFGRLTGVFLKHKSDQAEREFLNRRLTSADLEVMDRNTDGKVDYEEFVRFMLVSMGKVTMEDMDRLKGLYEDLDVDHDGSLQINDLILMANSENQDYGR